MEVYRLANKKFSADISGQGAKMYGGRWNPINVAMLYTSQHRSLCVLEIIAHNPTQHFEIQFDLVTIKIPETKDAKIIESKNLKPKWNTDYKYTRGIGFDFSKSNLLWMQVPSLIVPQEHHIILNPNHPLFKKVKIINKETFNLDQRLLKK